jgi:hypothetical protein
MNTLTLPAHENFASWNVTLHRMLESSGLFHVERADLPTLNKSDGGRRAGNLSVVAVNGVQVGIDTWDTPDPVTIAADRRCFDAGRVLAEVKLVLKIQWSPLQQTAWDRVPVPVRPWTVFPSREFPLGAFRYQPAKRHRYIAAVTGAMRHRRGEWFDAARKRSDFFVADEKRAVPMDEWLGILADCRWGLSLGGKRGTDMKNRRESEFASCGLPLALNYDPHYPVEFAAGKQYLRVDSPADIDAMIDTPVAPFAQAADQLWAVLFSPCGMSLRLLDAVRSISVGSLRGDDSPPPVSLTSLDAV